MVILISGTTGFLGSYLLKNFLSKGFEVIALKRSTSNLNRIENLLNEVTFYDVDKINLNVVFENHKIDLVINTVTEYGRSDNQISSIIETNLIFSLKLLELSMKYKVNSFINTDTLLERNINVYALSKAQFVDWMKYLSSENVKMINVKIEHMYGLLDDDNKFIYWLINQLKKNVNKIDLTSGIQKRDFIYISDVVSAFETIIDNIESLSPFEEFELGSGKSIEVKKLISLLYKQIKEEQEITTILNFGVVEYRKNENMNMEADISKLAKLGWNPKVSLESGINKILNGASKHD